MHGKTQACSQVSIWTPYQRNQLMQLCVTHPLSPLICMLAVCELGRHQLSETQCVLLPVVCQRLANGKQQILLGWRAGCPPTVLKAACVDVLELLLG